MNKEIDIGFMKAFDMLNKRELKKNGYDILMITIIDPIDFDMKITPIIYEDFGFIFSSTDEKIYDYMVDTTHKFLSEHTTKLFINVDFDKIKKEIDDLSKTKASVKNLDKILDSFMKMLVLTSPNTFHTKAYSSDSNGKGDILHSLYVGTKKLEPEEIRDEYIKKIDWMETTEKNSDKSLIFMVMKK